LKVFMPSMNPDFNDLVASLWKISVYQKQFMDKLVNYSCSCQLFRPLWIRFALGAS